MRGREERESAAVPVAVVVQCGHARVAEREGERGRERNGDGDGNGSVCGGTQGAHTRGPCPDHA